MTSSRWVLYSDNPHARPQEAANVARDKGATVVAVPPDSVIVETDEPTVVAILESLPGWQYTAERREARKPGPPGRRGQKKRG